VENLWSLRIDVQNYNIKQFRNDENPNYVEDGKDRYKLVQNDEETLSYSPFGRFC
jgi:hypothetical protein